MEIRFEKNRCRPEDGEPRYRMLVDGEEVRSGLSLDQVIAEINRRDELDLGIRHTGGKS